MSDEERRRKLLGFFAGMAVYLGNNNHEGSGGHCPVCKEPINGWTHYCGNCLRLLRESLNDENSASAREG